MSRNEGGLEEPVNTPRHQGRKTTCGSPNATPHNNTGSGEGCQVYRIGRGSRICQSWGSGRRGRREDRRYLTF